MEQNQALKDELAFFEEKLQEWLQHYAGQYVLIRGRDLVGAYTSFQDAYAAGVEKFGNQPMLIRQVTATPRVDQAPALTHGLIRLGA